MRTFLTVSLVLASFVFSVGGVAVSGRADATNQSRLEGGQCKAPMQPADARIHAAQLEVGGDTIPLNTRGYNYAGPGEIQMDPTPRAPASHQPPASPAKP